MFNLLLLGKIAFAIGLAASGTEPQSAGPVTGGSSALNPKQLTAAQWREDLRFMAAEMQRRHKNLFHTISKEQFAAAVADLDARIPTLQRHEIIVGMMRIAAMVGDGHTRVDPRKDAKFQMPSLPLKLYLFEDGLYVRAAMPAQADLVGARIEAIGGVSVEEAIRRAAEISSRDNEIGPKSFVPMYLNMPPLLHALKLAQSPGEASLTLRKGGRVWTASVPAGAVEPLWPPDTDISLVTPKGWVDARKTPKPPMWLEDPLNYHRMIALPQDRALYVQINMVTNLQDQTLAQFAEKIAGQVNATNPGALILDLRLAHGGNGGLRTPLIRQLIKLEDADTRLFVLTGRGTFSASQFILDDLDRLTDAVFVGEPASSKPSSFGDAYKMPLPNSGISIRSSLTWWQEGQDDDPWTGIDIAAPLTFAAYAAGRDPALEAALNFKEQPPLRDRVLEAAKTEGPEAAVRTVEAYLADPATRYADRETTTIKIPEYLNGEKQPESAFATAQLVAKRFSDTRDAFVVLALIGESTRHLEIAQTAAERALQIDPNDRLSRSLLERIKKARQ